MTLTDFQMEHRMTGEMYAALRDACENIGRIEYDLTLSAYARTHKSTRRYRYDPSPVHRILFGLLTCDALDAYAMHQTVNAVLASIGHTMPGEVYSIVNRLDLDLARMALNAC